MNLMGILILALTAALWYLYHKLFNVVYVNALAGIAKEIAACFFLSVIILTVVSNALGIKAKPKDKTTDQPPSQAQTDPSPEQINPIRNLLPGQGSSQEPPVKSFYGNFNSTSLLNNGIYDVLLTIGDSEWSQDGLSVFGFATAPGLNFVQTFNAEIPMPEGNSFTFAADEIGSTLTITLHPEDHTLEIVQEPTIPNLETPYTGSYVDSETWKGLRDQWSAAVERNEAMAMPNRWIGDYAGRYILEAFAEGEEGAPYAVFDVIFDEHNANTFQFWPALWVGGNSGNPLDWAFYDIPFPLGNRGSNHIEHETADGLIAFDVLEDKPDGRHVIQVTACPHLESVGTFVSGAENLDAGFLKQGERLNWPGDYVCESGGADGTKSISISQVNDQLLSIEMVHNYADGRVETYHADAEINAYGNGVYYALSVGDKWIDFKLQVDSDTGGKVVRVEQNGITATDPEFQGTYLREP